MISYLWGVAWLLWSLAMSILVQQAFNNNTGGDGLKNLAYGIFGLGVIFVIWAAVSQAKREKAQEKLARERHQELIDEIKKLTNPPPQQTAKCPHLLTGRCKSQTLPTRMELNMAYSYVKLGFG